jgi:hypothetical protein
MLESREGATQEMVWAVECGKMDPMLESREGATQEMVWRYQEIPEGGDESMREMSLDLGSYEA